MPALATRWALLEPENSALVRALLTAERPWPDALVQALAHYPLRADQPRHWTPPQHFRELLQRAAYRCPLSGLVKITEHDRPSAWYGDLLRFNKVVEFRLRMRQAFSG